MEYRLNARGRRAPLVAALAAVMLGAAGADAHAGASGKGRKTGAKVNAVTECLCQSPLERIRAKYGLKQDQSSADPSVGANANPQQKYKADANGAKPRKVNMERIHELAQPRPPTKLKVVPEVVDTRWPGVGRVEPGRQLQSRGVGVRSKLLRPPLPHYGYKPKPSYAPPLQPLGGVLPRPVKPEYERMAKLEADNAQVERESLEIAQAPGVEWQVPLPFPVTYRDVELKDLSVAGMIVALLESDEIRLLFNLDSEQLEQAQKVLAILRDVPEAMPENSPNLAEEIEQLSQEVLASAFDTALTGQQYTRYTFRHAFGRAIEPKLSGDRVFGFRLRKVMPFAHLPYPDNIAAVVARVTAATADSARYVVAYFDDQGHLHAPGGFAGLGSDADPNQDVGGRFDSAQLSMDQVEFVLYRPHRGQPAGLL